MPDTPSIVIVKSFTYRGAVEEFSNKYHFTGTTPSNDAAWITLADAIIAAEKACTGGWVNFVRAYGYVAGTEHSVAQIDYESPPLSVVAGAMSGVSGNPTAGDQAATVRWYTGELNSRGKKIYCRKYLHGVLADASAPDKLAAAQRTKVDTFAAKLIDGTLPGGFKYCGPQGATLGTGVTDQWITTRTLKRRGRRPLP